MPTEKQENLDRDEDDPMMDDDETDMDMDQSLDLEQEEDDDRAGMGSPMGNALDAEDAKKGDVHIDDETAQSDDDIGEDATD